MRHRARRGRSPGRRRASVVVVPGLLDDAAIAVIQQSGLVYEVGAMGTTIQGTPDQLWPLLRAVHEATVQAGASAVSSVIKVGQGKDDAGPTIQDLVGKFRA